MGDFISSVSILLNWSILFLFLASFLWLRLPELYWIVVNLLFLISEESFQSCTFKYHVSYGFFAIWSSLCCGSSLTFLVCWVFFIITKYCILINAFSTTICGSPLFFSPLLSSCNALHWLTFIWVTILAFHKEIPLYHNV